MQLTTVHKPHAEVTRTLALTDIVNRNNARVIQAGGRFCFQAKTPQVRFRCPMAHPYDLKRDGAIKAFLPGAINHALSATTDFFQQFVVPKVGKGFCRTRIAIRGP